MPKPFFFSYARNDAGNGPVPVGESMPAGPLQRFLAAVNYWVRSYTGLKEDAFVDNVDLRAGEDWSAKLAVELRASPAMVSMYSPSYFASRICSREMQIFLERRLAYIRANPGLPPANIIPVLWVPPEKLPVSLPEIQYERALSSEKAGLLDVVAYGDEREFQQIASKVAARVRNALKVKLPDLTYTPNLNGLESAFEPPPLPPSEFDVAEAKRGPDCVIYVYASSPHWEKWPFPPPLNPILHLSAAVAKGRELYTHQLTFDPAAATLIPRLRQLRQHNSRVVVLVNGQNLDDPALNTRMREYDEENIDASSTLVVWPTGQRPAGADNLLEQTFPKLSRRRPPAFFPHIETEDDFVEAMRTSLDSLHNAVLRRPQGVAPITPTSAYPTLPTVAAPGQRAGG